MRNYIAMTICLLFWWTLQARGQEPHEFGTLSVGGIKSYQYTPSENDYGQWFCFTLAEPADVYLTLKRLNAMDSMIQLYDNEENGITVNEVESASDQIKTYVNLPAGNYQIFVDYTERNYTELYIEASRPDMEAFETNLGTFDASFSETLERNMEDTYAFFHGAGYDGYSCHKLELGRAMDFDVSLAGSTVKSSNIKLLNAQHAEVSSSENMNGLCSLHVANLAKGIYHVLVKSYDDSGTLAFCVSGHAETGVEDKSDGTNHIVERTYTNASGDSWNDKVTYFDEMGREEEVVEKGASPDASSDYVTLTEYDMFGHVSKKWLPAVMSGNQGKYIAPADLMPDVVTSQQGDSKPFALTEYEPSPANRVTAEFGVGAAWQDKGKAQRTDYLLNNTKFPELNCMRYSVSGSMGGMKVDCKGSYADGNLTVTVLTDEDGRKSYKFKDGWGNTILQRKEVDGVFADTYYIYDAWGNLMATLPPMASNEMCVTGKSWSEKDDLVASYAYLYAYDGQKRQVGSKLPGCDWSYVIYDRADTPILTQDGEQRQRGEWSFTIPDVWGRPCLGGVCKNNVTVGTELSNVSATYSGSSSNYGYTVTGLSLTSPTYHKITYYDSYDFLSNSSLGMSSLAFDGSRGSDFNTLEKSCAKGKMTGCISAMDGLMSNALKSACYYDYRGRAIQEVSTNHLGGLDKTLKAYDFTDNCVRELGIHSAKGKSSYTTDVRYTYDHMGRLLTTAHAVNKNAAVTISTLEYDKLGKMVAERRNGNGKLKSTYAYNIRDWQKNISGALFSEQLFYQESHLGNTPQYGGNVSAMDWKTGDMGKTRGYVFGYDSMSRLKSASYSEDGTSNGHYSTSYTYDLQGNMETLTRKGMLDDKAYDFINIMCTM